MRTPHRGYHHGPKTLFTNTEASLATAADNEDLPCRRRTSAAEERSQRPGCDPEAAMRASELERQRGGVHPDANAARPTTFRKGLAPCTRMSIHNFGKPHSHRMTRFFLPLDRFAPSFARFP